jgi:hypothetical protein
MHLMMLSLVINKWVMYNLPFLIVRLGKHDMILGRIWLARYKVLVDYGRRRLLWPEEVSLREEIQAKQFIQLPRKLLLKDHKIEIQHQEDTDQRDKAFQLQEKKVASGYSTQRRQDLHAASLQRERIPTTHRRKYERRHTLELSRIRKGFNKATNEAIIGADNDNPNPNKATNETIISKKKIRKARFQDRYPEANIALVGASGFMCWVKDKKSEIFITSLSEIEKAIEDKQQLSGTDPEAQEIKEQLPKIYHEFTDIFSKRKSDELPERKEYDHCIELEKEVELGYCPLY